MSSQASLSSMVCRSRAGRLVQVSRYLWLVLVFLAIAATTARAAGFTDPNLQAAVEAAIGHPAVDWTAEELRNLTALDAMARGITDLAGIESLTNLVALDLADNRVTDLSPLSSLINLTHLNLERNQAANLSPLMSLSRLQVLLLLGNQVTDLAPLLGLPALVEVDVRDNPLSLTAREEDILALVARGVQIEFDPSGEGTASSDTGWVFLGPTPPAWNSSVTKLVVAPDAPNVIYAATDIGLYLSRDDGATWEQTGLMAGSYAYEINVAVDATDPATVYELGDGLRSTDWGAHWQRLSVPGQLFTADPVQGDRLYCRRSDAGTDEADLVAISDDGGQTWRNTEVQLAGWNPQAWRHPAADGVIYLSSRGQNAQYRVTQRDYYRSEDNGRTWRALAWSQDFGNVVGDPADPASLYAIQGGLVFHSSDLGTTWTQLSNIGMTVYNDLVVHPVDPSWLLAWADNRSAQSHDAGRTWKRLTFQPVAMQPHPTDPAQGFSFTGWQTWRTRDSGTTWDKITLSAMISPVQTLRMDAAGTLYAGTCRHDPYQLPELQRSTDRGANWEVVALPDMLPIGDLTLISPNPKDPDLLLAYPGTGTSFFRSEDGGRQWQIIAVGENINSPYPSEMSTTGSDQRIYYLLQPYTRDLYRSDDAAVTWTQVSPRRLDHLAVHPTDESILFSVAKGELLRSGDGGAAWDTFRQSERQDSILAMAITPNPPYRLLTLGRQTLYDCGLATDDGCVARQAPQPVLSADLSGAFLRCDPVTPSSLYLVLPHEIWSTRDAGETWQRLAFGPVAAPYFTDLAVSPQDPSLIFVSTSWGVYRVTREQVTAVKETPDTSPTRFSLAPNYPNPFNAQTTITYQLPARQRVSLVIYDVLGRPERRLVTGEQEAGEYRLAWDGRDDQGREVGSGVYLCRLVAGGRQWVVRLVLVR